jgi:hypothetical protein
MKEKPLSIVGCYGRPESGTPACRGCPGYYQIYDADLVMKKALRRKPPSVCGPIQEQIRQARVATRQEIVQVNPSPRYPGGKVINWDKKESFWLLRKFTRASDEAMLDLSDTIQKKKRLAKRKRSQLRKAKRVT